MERGKTEVRNAVSNSLLWMACLPPGTKMTSRAKLLSRVMFGFLTLLQPKSELVSMALVATEGSADARVLISHLRPCWY